MSRRIVVASASLALALAACGTSGAPSSHPVQLSVLAASSLTNVLPRIGDLFAASHPSATLTYSFAGTDALAAQIEQGAPADVFAGASPKYGDQLVADGQIEAWRAFCTNRLVVVLPASNPAGIGSLRDLARPGIKLVIGAESVPVGSYTRTVLTNLDASYGAQYSSAVLANVVSNEDNVEGVLTKVRLGEADAGFVYITDATAAGAAVKVLELPDAAQAVATYPVAVVTASGHPSVSQSFVDFLLSSPAQALLRGAGFGPPPTP